jgi:phosphoribosyl-AMP cyclohydrolase
MQISSEFKRETVALANQPGATSGLKQTIRELLIDDDQDCIWLRVDVAGGASCFYRNIPVAKDCEQKQSKGHIDLEWTDTTKVFDPQEVYGDAPNPTIL